MPHIFISYAKRDSRELAMNLVEKIESMPGMTAWMDYSLEPDASWAFQIQQEIDRADYVVVLLSPDVNRTPTANQPRGFVLNEIDYAQQDNKTILPVLVRRTKVPVQLAGVQYINLTASPNDPTPILTRIGRRFKVEGYQADDDEDDAGDADIPRRRVLSPMTIVAAALVVVVIAAAVIVLPNLTTLSSANSTETITQPTDPFMPPTIASESAGTDTVSDGSNAIVPLAAVTATPTPNALRWRGRRRLRVLRKRRR